MNVLDADGAPIQLGFTYCVTLAGLAGQAEEELAYRAIRWPRARAPIARALHAVYLHPVGGYLVDTDARNMRGRLTLVRHLRRVVRP